MASMSFSLAATLLLLSLNLLFISMVSSSSHVDCSTCGGSTKSPPPPPPKSTPCPPPPPHKSTPTKPQPPPKSTPTTTPPPKSTPPTTPYQAPPPKSTPPTTSGSCPRDTLKLGVCADLLKGLLNVQVGTPASSPCCSLLNGLTDLEAAVCLCTAIKANVLGINLNVPVSLSLLVNACGKKAPSGFQCT